MIISEQRHNKVTKERMGVLSDSQRSPEKISEDSTLQREEQSFRFYLYKK